MIVSTSVSMFSEPFDSHRTARASPQVATPLEIDERLDVHAWRIVVMADMQRRWDVAPPMRWRR